MAKCYVWQGKGGDNLNYAFALCVSDDSTVGWINSSAYPDGSFKLPAVDGSVATGADGFFITPAGISQPNNQAAYNAAVSGRGVRGNCGACLFQGDLYDCINGQCIHNTVYSTPGIYKSLEECRAVCGNNQSCPAPFKCLDPDNYCPPGKVCISSSEWSQIESLSGQLRAKNCS